MDLDATAPLGPSLHAPTQPPRATLEEIIRRPLVHRAIGAVMAAVWLWPLVQLAREVLARGPNWRDLFTLGHMGTLFVVCLVRPVSVRDDLRAHRVAVALGSTFLLTPFLVVDPRLGLHGAASIALEVVTYSISAAGIWAKCALGRSLTVIASQRALVTRGPYALVRHPIYAVWLGLRACDLVVQHQAVNVALSLALAACLVARARWEEAMMAGDPGWDAYAARVRWRFVPGVY